MGVPHTAVVGAQPSDHDVPLPLLEALGPHWIWQKHKVQRKAPYYSHASGKVVHVPPCTRVIPDRSEPVVDQGRDAADVAGARVPDSHPHGLLVLLVEGADDEHEHGADTALQRSEEEAFGINALVALADDGQQQAETPEDNGSRGDALDRISLCEVHGWVGADDESEVEDGGGHGIAVTDVEAQVVDDTKQGLPPREHKKRGQLSLMVDHLCCCYFVRTA